MVKMNRFFQYGCIAALSGILLITSACGNKKPAETTSVPKPAQTDGSNTVEAAGIIKANDIRNISLDFPVKVEAVPVKEGQRVVQGEELMVLDIHEIRQQIEDVENNIKIEKLQLEKNMKNNSDANSDYTKTQQSLVNNIETAENELQRQKTEYNETSGNDAGVKLKESEYQKAQEELKRANEDLDKKQQLFNAGVLSQNDLDTATRRAEDAEKAVEDKRLSLEDARTVRQQALDKLQTGITQQQSKIDDLKLDLKSLKATSTTDIDIQRQKIAGLESDLQRLQDKLSKSFIKDNTIICDYNKGLVQESTHLAGDAVQAGSKLLSVVNMDSLVVEADVSEDFIKDVKLGAEVDIYLLADAGKQYKGKVLKIADMGREKDGETMVFTEISIENPDDFIKPNFNVDVKIRK